MVKKNVFRFEIWLVQLDPTQGCEMRKTRPCVIISPDEMSALKTAIVAPMTTKGFHFPTRIECTFQGKKGLILLDQMRAVDKSRLLQKLGMISKSAQISILTKVFTHIISSHFRVIFRRKAINRNIRELS